MSRRSRRRARVLPVRLRESAATAERAELRESVFGAIGEQPNAVTAGGLVVDVQIIEAGWNKAGTKYYPADVLLRDAPAAFPAGTHAHIDHPTLSDEVERPERSLQTLAAVVAETPYSPDGGKTMRAKFRVFSPYVPFLREAWENIGVSINADGSGRYGEAEGRQGLLVEAITVGKSIDFVTKPGAGGRIVSLLESARATALTESSADSAEPTAGQVALREARTWGAWLESRLHLTMTAYCDDAYGDGRLTREERITLSSAVGDALDSYTARIEADAPQLYQRDLWSDPQPVAVQESTRLRESTSDQVRAALTTAVRDAYGAERTWCWVRDYDADKNLVWFDIDTDDECHTFQQAYATTGEDAQVVVDLDGDRVEVVAQTVYVPAPTPAPAADLTEADRPAPAAAPDRVPTDVTDGTAPAAPNPLREEPSMSEDTTGPAPGTAGTDGTTTPPTETVNLQAREADAARVKAEGERDTALREAEESKRELARFRAVEAARPVASAKLTESDLPAAAQARVLASVVAQVPLTEAGVLDEAKLTALIEAEATAEKTYLASLAEADGAGKVRGFGAQPTDTAPAVAPIAPPVNQQLRESYIARGLSPTAADFAATGRPF